MKMLVKRMSLPLLLLLGLALIAPQAAEAGRWRRYARRAYARPYYVAAPVVYVPAVRYVEPVVVYTPPVRVYAPAVRVDVGRAVYVDAPGVRVRVGARYPAYYGRAYYGW
jgi:hypothetical protein